MSTPHWAQMAQRRADQRKGTLSGLVSFVKRYQVSSDKESSRARRRSWSRYMPDPLARRYTEGLRAVGGVIAAECKKTGICDWCVDKIAATAGVCRTMVQTYFRLAKLLGHIEVQYRPVKGQKSLTNVVTIVEKEWLKWIKRAPIGLKPACPTKITESSLGAALDQLGDNLTPFWVRSLVAALNGEPAPRYGPS